jgi:hypothetical protein
MLGLVASIMISPVEVSMRSPSEIRLRDGANFRQLRAPNLIFSSCDKFDRDLNFYWLALEKMGGLF